jgi:hypothetical protein
MEEEAWIRGKCYATTVVHIATAWSIVGCKTDGVSITQHIISPSAIPAFLAV